MLSFRPTREEKRGVGCWSESEQRKREGAKTNLLVAGNFDQGIQMMLDYGLVN